MDAKVLVEARQAREAVREAKREARGWGNEKAADGPVATEREIPGLTADEIGEWLRRRQYVGRGEGYRDGRQAGYREGRADGEVDAARDSREWVVVTLEIIGGELDQAIGVALADVRPGGIPEVGTAQMIELRQRIDSLRADVESNGLSA